MTQKLENVYASDKVAEIDAMEYSRELEDANASIENGVFSTNEEVFRLSREMTQRFVAGESPRFSERDSPTSGHTS